MNQSKTNPVPEENTVIFESPKRFITLEEAAAQMWGPRGTPKREELEREMDRLGARRDRIERTFGWMRRIPLVGIVAYVWWSSLVDEGLMGAIDAMCFSFFDDVNPTLPRDESARRM